MGGKGVSQRGRRNATGNRRLAHPLLEPATYVRGAQAPPAAADEQRRLLRGRPEGVASDLEVATERALGRLADGHQAGLRALAGDANGLGLEVDVRGVDRDDLLGTQ